MQNYKVVVNRRNENDDELYHFKYFKREKRDGKWHYYYDYNNGRFSDNAGVSVGKNRNGEFEVSLYNTKNKKYYNKHGEGKTTQRGGFKVQHAEDGVKYTLTFKKRSAKSFAKNTVMNGSRKVDRMLNGTRKKK